LDEIWGNSMAGCKFFETTRLQAERREGEWGAFLGPSPKLLNSTNMTRVLLILTIAMSVASAFLSHVTKQKALGLTEEKQRSEGEAQKFKSELAKLTATQKETDAKIEELSKGKGTLMEESNKAKEELKVREAEIAKMKEEGTEKANEILKLQEKLKVAEERAKMPAAPNPEIEAKLTDLTAQLQRSQHSAVELEKHSQGLSAQVEDLKKKLEKEKKRAIKLEMLAKEDGAAGAGGGLSDPSSALTVNAKSGGDEESAAPENAGDEDDVEAVKRKLQERLRTLQGKILSYDAEWNVVVVNLGRADGVTMETPMQIYRGGKVVAKLRIKNVSSKNFTAMVMPVDTKRKVLLVENDFVKLASASGQ
jgi:hypothetical protein